MRFHAPELFVLKVIMALIVLDVGLVIWRGVELDIPGYLTTLAIGAGSLAVGQYYRRKSDERIALAMTAAGLFILFSSFGSAFNYLLLPMAGERIDLLLMRADSFFGYDWASFASVVAASPFWASLLKFVYLSSMPQLIAAIVILGFSNQKDQLHQFILTGVFAALMTIGFWGFFPSSGPAAYATLPPEISNGVRLVVGSEYGSELNRLIAEGVQKLSPSDSLGLIAFPSFHTVMALMVVVFLRGYKPGWLFVAALNLLMIPAILVHGGHHFVDLLGGIAVFGIAYYVAKKAASKTADGAIANVIVSTDSR